MTRFSRTRGIDLFTVTRRQENPRIYLPSLAVPERRKTIRNFTEDIKLVMKNAAYPPQQQERGRRGHYPCRGIDLKTALYDCNERRLYISACEEVSKCSPDLSFETQVTDWGGGPNGNEIPQGFDENEASIDLVWPSDKSAGPSDTYYLQDHAFEEVDAFRAGTYWVRDTTDPRTGTFHLSAEYGNSPADHNTRALWIANFKLCSPFSNPLLGPKWVTAAMSQGQSISASIWARHTAAITGVYGFWRFIYYDAAGESISASSQGVQAIGSTYGQISFSANAPASTAYAALKFETGILSTDRPSGNTVIFIDDLSVSAPDCV